MFWLRAHQITRQEPFIDEGLHVGRARAVWSFEQNPGRFANGKLLIYFWLGLFDLQPVTALYVARTSIALFSLISGAGLYTLGRQMGGYAVGLLALAIYTVFPLAFFFERMALADPFASAFAVLVAWRSLVLARRPSLREGALIGLLAALATLAKLTLGLIPLLPVVAVMAFSSRPDRRSYLPALGVMTAVIVIAWLPVLIPAAAAYHSPHPFVLINGENMQELARADPAYQLRSLLPQMSGYISPALLLALISASFYLFCRAKTQRYALFLWTWLALILLLSLLAAVNTRSRYLMPMAPPILLLIAYTLVELWRSARPAFLVRSMIMAAGGLWLVGFALPFVTTAWSDPARLPLSERDAHNYFSGNFAGDAFRQTAILLEQVEPPADHVYASVATCDMLFFFTTRPVHCLHNDRHPIELTQHEVSYLIFNGHEKAFDPLGLDWELIAIYERPMINRTVRVWRVRVTDRGKKLGRVNKPALQIEY